MDWILPLFFSLLCFEEENILLQCMYVLSGAAPGLLLAAAAPAALLSALTL